ncbi:MAG TPA: LuxR C-terminal-related transcriptional regulator, partial [Humisphaera sp.]|nr:LuxR C-terminal-related transcriptional regulator [Humisphaera sp.]
QIGCIGGALVDRAEFVPSRGVNFSSGMPPQKFPGADIGAALVFEHAGAISTRASGLQNGSRGMGDECSMCVSAVNCRTVAIPAFLAASLWQHVVDTLKLSPQQARMVGLMLQGMQDKQIAAEMKLSLCTIRTYMRRLFDRLGVDSRGGVILRVFALCASSGAGVGFALCLTYLWMTYKMTACSADRRRRMMPSASRTRFANQANQGNRVRQFNGPLGRRLLWYRWEPIGKFAAPFLPHCINWRGSVT